MAGCNDKNSSGFSKPDIARLIKPRTVAGYHNVIQPLSFRTPARLRSAPTVKITVPMIYHEKREDGNSNSRKSVVQPS
jgi:hypothetical protein